MLRGRPRCSVWDLCLILFVVSPLLLVAAPALAQTDDAPEPTAVELLDALNTALVDLDT